MSNGKPRTAHAVAVWAVVLLLVGCGRVVEDEVDRSEGFVGDLATEISPHQLDVLESLGAEGSVSFEDYFSAEQDFADCIRDNGGLVTKFEIVDDRGPWYVEVGILNPVDSGLADAQFERVLDECSAYNRDAVAGRYWANPGAIEAAESAEEARLTRLGPGVIDCLNAGGEEYARDAPSEVWSEAAWAALEFGPASVVDCLNDVGWP